MHSIRLIRAYNHRQLKNAKGYKLLIDRLWPRGVKKTDLPYQWWLKELAPTPSLRAWFNHQADRYPTFKQKYLNELKENPFSPSVLEFLTQILQSENIILIYSAKDDEHNQVVVFKEWLEGEIEAME
ncbi:MAG: DUF488 family protein [Aerococcus sp.]|nr:DUF488 family protein [Aerococcus sp.]